MLPSKIFKCIRGIKKKLFYMIKNNNKILLSYAIANILLDRFQNLKRKKMRSGCIKRCKW